MTLSLPKLQLNSFYQKENHSKIFILIVRVIKLELFGSFFNVIYKKCNFDSMSWFQIQLFNCDNRDDFTPFICLLYPKWQLRFQICCRKIVKDYLSSLGPKFLFVLKKSQKWFLSEPVYCSVSKYLAITHKFNLLHISMLP